MNLVKENIEFKRGQDPKTSLDIGMTTERLLEDTIQKLKDAGLRIDDYNLDKHIFKIEIRDSDNYYEISYNSIKKIWISDGAPTPFNIDDEFDSQLDILENLFDHLEEKYREKITKFKMKVGAYTIKHKNMDKALRNLLK